jgi:hypothetical protein
MKPLHWLGLFSVLGLAAYGLNHRGLLGDLGGLYRPAQPAGMTDAEYASRLNQYAASYRKALEMGASPEAAQAAALQMAGFATPSTVDKWLSAAGTAAGTAANVVMAPVQYVAAAPGRAAQAAQDMVPDMVPDSLNPFAPEPEPSVPAWVIPTAVIGGLAVVGLIVFMPRKKKR